MRTSMVLWLAACNLQPVSPGASEADLAALQAQVTALQEAMAELESTCVKDDALAPAIEAALEDVEPVDLSDYATLTDLADADAALRTWVEAQDYLIPADLAGLATLTDLAPLASLSDVAATDAATRAWVEAHGYLVVSDLSPYATTAWVQAQDYVKPVDLGPYATTAWVEAGYTGQSDHDDLVDRVAELEALGLDPATADLMGRLADYLDVDPVAHEVRLSGANVYIDNGDGDTYRGNGMGNLILGYNGGTGGAVDRAGSHNLVVGDGLAWPASATVQVARNIESYGQVIAEGYTGRGASVFRSGQRTVSTSGSLLFGADEGTTWVVSVGGFQVGGTGPILGGTWLLVVADDDCSVSGLGGLSVLVDVNCGPNPGPGSSRPWPVTVTYPGAQPLAVSWMKLGD